jgi:outer membrane immunogenic protein
VLGGGQIGYNWQIAPSFLFGLEADIQGSGYKGSSTVSPTPIGFAPFNTTVEQHSDWFGTFRGRAGFLATPGLLIYGTGGLAYGQTEASLSTFGSAFGSVGACPANFSCAAAGASSTRAGWTAGGGLEWMFAPHWTLRGEYLYVDLGSQSVTAVTPVFAPPVSFTASTPFHENIGRAAINYKF